ncbi:DUF2514 family protein [Atopomonas sediminilitoris]|uniref:DUF2514 family protein n=1 Tax=Atopomonas sediminilitoris TaxID=2919919 RepID=UPI001F4EE066|nr:DUF2514 family protein [Atopomonas sediminilitoris]MCJ8168623.1 DUF2514 domain-containing protein [Atopomonas sediminilitoris]
MPTQSRLIAVAVVLALAFAAGWLVNGWRWQAKLSALELTHAEQYASAQAQARSEEQRRQTAVEGIRRDAQRHIDQSQTDAATAGAAANGLRAALDTAKHRAASCASATTGSPTGPDQATVLADLLAELEQEGRAMAAEADRRGIAGRTCEQYAAATQQQKRPDR